MVWDFLGNVGVGRPKLQRYPLRSGAKSKEEKPPVAELSNHSASKRYLVFLVFVFCMQLFTLFCKGFLILVFED